MRKQHLAELGVLMKRIESKMKEYAKQKDEDIYKVQQRNRFIQATFDSKHVSCPSIMGPFSPFFTNNVSDTMFLLNYEGRQQSA